MEVQKVDMDEMKTETELHIKRPRKKTNYRKINNQTRQQLVEMVKENLTDKITRST